MEHIKKYSSLSLLFNVAIIMLGIYSLTINITASGYAPIRTTWVNMTVAQNLYTQYHKLIFPKGCEEYENSYGDCYYENLLGADFSVTYRYIQSRNGSQIAQSLWGSQNLIFQGAETQLRADNGLIAEYFGMGPDTNGYITLNPRLRNQVVDFQLALSGSQFWAQINLPVTYAKWDVLSGCKYPSMQGTYGKSNLNGAVIDLNYAPSGDVAIAGTKMSPVTNNLYFDGGESGTETNSFIKAIEAGGFSNVDTDNVDIDTWDITYKDASGGAIQGYSLIGYLNMGLYGAFDQGDATEFEGQSNVTFTSNEVLAAPDPVTALGGYTFGMVEQRNNNLFNFNPSGKWRLAEIPIMVGYDFCKSDVSHLGVYLKCVIPTGTKIDQSFLKYVLNPVIGNGRHFELGIGLTGHANVWACDETSFGIYGDGYIDYMFGVCQNRTFDLKNQPMSRYALVYNLAGNQIDGYSVNDTISAVGDINLYQGNVTATRGEFMLDAIWAYKNFEVGLGYAFAGQTAQAFDCLPSSTAGSVKKAYALVGQVLQDTIGVGVVSAPNIVATFNVAPYNNTTSFPASNFYYLGSTEGAAQVSAEENAIYNYGEDVFVDDAAFALPDLQGNFSGVMSRQVLNKIFGHLDYVWKEHSWQPEIGILGSIGFVPAGSPTANYWDLGARIGFAF